MNTTARDETERQLVDVLVRNLLARDERDGTLMARLWEEFTPDQRRLLADRAFEVAMGRLDSYVNGRLFAIGYAAGSTDNMLREHVRAQIRRALEEHELLKELGAQVSREAGALQGQLREFIRDELKGAYRRIIRAAIDLGAMRGALLDGIGALTERDVWGDDR